MFNIIRVALVSIFILLSASLFGQSTVLCPDPLATRKKVASSFHSTVMIDYLGRVRYWGDQSQPSGLVGGSSATTVPQTLTPALYGNGTPVAVAAGSIGYGSESNWNAHQLFLLASTGLYGWGTSNSTIGNTNGVITQMALPTSAVTGTGLNIVADDIEFIEASGGGVALVTKNDGVNANRRGLVFVKCGANTGGSNGLIYGDGTAEGTMNSNWHMVMFNAQSTVALNGIVRLSYSQKALMALRINPATFAYEMYVWGKSVYLGNSTAFADYSRAVQMTMPASVIPADMNIITAATYSSSTTNSASQFVLGTNGRIYALGNGHRGVLGQGNETHSTSWIVVKGPSGGSTELTNVVQISSNNAYVASGISAYYSVGALTNTGEIYLWGDNSYNMIGGTATNYTLPQIPPNYNVNLAKVGFFHMGGHTTIAFLAGSNRFCYIGHLVRGSMGDGSAADGQRSSYDCINTPDDYLCTPPPDDGCSEPTANDLAASSSRAVLIINGKPSATYWGQSSSSAEAGVNVLSPRVLYEYNGKPKGVAASAKNPATATEATQMWILTTEGIWGWGISANTISSSLAGSVGMTYLALPGGITAADVSFIRSSRAGIAIVTNSGHVYIKAGTTSSCIGTVYGDGSTSLDNSWHQVTTSAAGNPVLSGVSELSFAGTSAMAITTSGDIYVWGNNTYAGNGAAASTKTRATLMDRTGLVGMPKTAEIIQSGSDGAAQFILTTGGKVYTLGYNKNGVLGLSSVAINAQLTTFAEITTLSSIRKIASNNAYADNEYAIGAINLLGHLYVWGSNNTGRLIGLNTTSDQTTPIRAKTAAATDLPAIGGFEMGAKHTIAFAMDGATFYYAGSYAGGSLATGANTTGINNYFTSTGVAVPNCAGAVYSISGNLYHDQQGLADSLVNGTGLNTLSSTVMYANLLDETGTVIGTTTINSAGYFTFGSYPSGNYTVQVSSVQGTVLNPAPDTLIPSDWMFNGAQTGTVRGDGIDKHIPNGTMTVALNRSVVVNFGVALKNVAAHDLAGNVYHDRNGTKDNLISSNAGSFPTSPLYVSLVYPFGTDNTAILTTVPVNMSDGTYSFSDIPVGPWNIVLHTNPAGAISSDLPAGWASSGEQLGTTTGVGISDKVDGILWIAMGESDNLISNANFGIEVPPVADAKSYNISSSAFNNPSSPVSGYPAVTNYYSITASSSALTGYSSGGSLSGTDEEDCNVPSSCNTNTSTTFIINSIAANTKLYYDFGGSTGIREVLPNTATATLENFDATKLVIYGEGGTGTSSLGNVSFTYSIVDAAGISSAPVSYGIETLEALPITLLSFNGFVKGNTSVLTWQTNNTVTAGIFWIMRSADGIKWEEIGSIPVKSGLNNPILNYEFVDTDPLGGYNYYHLAAKDVTGTTSISKTITLKHAVLENAVTIYPNPVQGVLNLKFKRDITSPLFVKIIDMNGTTIKYLQYTSGNHFEISTSVLGNGTYMVVLESENETISRKIIKK